MSYDAPKYTHIGLDRYGYIDNGSAYLPVGWKNSAPRKTKKEAPKLSGGKYQNETLNKVRNGGRRSNSRV